MNSPANLYALLIGIDCYLPRSVSGRRHYKHLAGCVRDIARVESFLKKRLGIPDKHITKLTASKGDGDRPTEPPEQWPTYENIVTAFKKLTNTASSGDQAYIHYSGHGRRARTLFPELKTNKWDECLVPMDIGQAEGCYLRDIEIAYLLQQMVEKGLIVTIILDSCYSGGATRGIDAATVRGLEDIDMRERPNTGLVASDEALIANWQKVSSTASRDLRLEKSGLPEPKGYVLLSACLPHERACEYLADGQEQYGALTFWLLDSLKTMGENATYQQIHDRLLPKMHSHFVKQTPMLQGDGDRIFFGCDRLKSTPSVNVIRVESERLLLNAGQAQGIGKGAKFAIYPPSVTDFTQSDRRLALVETTEIGAVESWAKIAERLGTIAIEPGFQAVLFESGSLRLQSKIYLGVPSRALEPIQHAFVQKGGGFVAEANEKSTVDYQVTVNDREEYEILDPAGSPLPNLRPVLNIREDRVAERLVGRLIHITKYHNVQRLDNTNTPSPLNGQLEVELLKAQPDYKPGNPPKSQPFERSGTIPTISVGEWMFVRVKNASPRVLNITILALSSSWKIQQLYPRIEDTSFWPFYPDEEHPIPLRPSLSEGYTEGIEIIKVFATVDATQFRWLELPALDRPLENNDFTGRNPTNSLEEYLAIMGGSTLAEEQRKFNTDAASLEWTMEQREIRLQNC